MQSYKEVACEDANKFSNFLKEDGITRQLSVEYTPQFCLLLCSDCEIRSDTRVIGCIRER